MLEKLKGCFTAPTFRTFALLVVGLIAQTGRRSVTGMLTAAGLQQCWPHNRAHSFFSRAVWDPELPGIVCSHVIARLLVPAGGPLTPAVDDTLFKRSGKKVFGAAWQHDGAAKTPRAVGRGTCFVVLGMIVRLPFLARPVCLPIMARMWRPKGEQTKVELAAAMIRPLAACHHRRRIDVVADAAYHGRPLRGLPEHVTFTTRLPRNAILYDLAPPRTGRRGRPRLRGERLGTPADLTHTLTFHPLTVTRYQRTDTVHLAERRCLWFGSLHTRTVRVILVAETTPGRPLLVLVTTDLTATAAELVARYASRWSIEVTFAQARENLGAGQAQSRTRRAVERTVPFALYCYTITVVWYTLHGHHPDDVFERRRRSPWYVTKAEPSFADMTAKLRRVIIAARYSALDPAHPTDDEIAPSSTPGPQPAPALPDPLRQARKSRGQRSPRNVPAPILRVSSRMRAPVVVGGHSYPEWTWTRREGRRITPWGGTTTRGLGLPDPAGLRRALRCPSRSTDRMPQRSVQQRAGFRGEAFVDKAVSDAGHVWNDTKRDFAIDGQIEFVAADREVTGVAVLAQVKGTEVGFRGATETEFKFTCKADHIAYWLRLGRPVVLICVDLRVQQAWWKRVDTWFAEPERKARRVVQFDKAADRFDLDAFSRLSALGVPAGEPLPRLEGSEQLVSNLLTVEGFAPLIHEASTPCRDRGDAWERMRSNGNRFESGFVLSAGRIYSLCRLDEGPLAVLCDGPVTSIPTQNWAT
ncbi:transposase, partial [Streptomyces sp. NPDC059786]|uniref:IS701 family transposase n=1 Tax=Streptomyces sp. NPDC059786 TaxID=3346946 RepID=UPI003656B9A7